MKKVLNTPNPLYNKVISLLTQARNEVVRTINRTMVYTYYELGRLIVEEEQKGRNRAQYGQELITELSKRLSKDIGKGFSVTNLKQMRSFYLVYEKGQTVSDQFSFKVSWSHYLKLMRIEDEKERNFYEIEAYTNNWSLREFQRQYDSALYNRLSLHKNKEQLIELAHKGQQIEKPQDAIKDPYILEFIGLPENKDYSEAELEQKLIDKIEQFLLELGKGFTFAGRQQRITIDEKHFRVDLVFYNRLLKCFVLVDLKIGELKHQDIGQMQMYVNYFDRFVCLKDENKTIGIILCQDKSDALVSITLPENNKQIFASKYKTILPSKEVLKSLLEV